jgi:hypothetical protein
MHIVIQKFIDGFKAQSRPYTLEAGFITSGSVRLEVEPSTDSDSPTAFRLSFASPLDVSDAMYPMLLLLFVFGKEFDTTGLMARQKSVIESGRRYTEHIGSWDYASFAGGSRWHMEITVA